MLNHIKSALYKFRHPLVALTAVVYVAAAHAEGTALDLTWFQTIVDNLTATVQSLIPIAGGLISLVVVFYFGIKVIRKVLGR